MTIDERLNKLHVPSIEVITLYRKSVMFYRGTIANLLKNRKDLLKLKLVGELVYKVGEGYTANCA